MLEPSYLLSSLLLLVGFLLLSLEMFVPTGGVLAVLSLALLLVGILLNFQLDALVGFITLVSVAVLVPVLLVGGLHYWPRTSLGKQLVLAPPPEAEHLEEKKLDRLLGRFGRAASVLRPGGTAEFDGEKIEVLTEGMPVESGQLVRCIAVRAGRVWVRPVESTRLTDLETARFE